MKNKKSNIIIVILCMIFLVLGIILGIIVYDKIINKVKPTEPTVLEEPKEEELTQAELLTKISGEWGTCKDGSCYGLIISKKENGEYYYTPYLMWSEGTPGGIVKQTSKVEKDTYKVTVHYDAYEDFESSGIEHTDEYKINISEVDTNVIYINETKYQKITIDREKFFNSIK